MRPGLLLFSLGTHAGAHGDTVARLGEFLDLGDRIATLVTRVNAKGHSSPPRGRSLKPAWREALVADLAQAQDTLVRVCRQHGTTTTQ